jgi:ArsR family transcriptional regulator
MSQVIVEQVSTDVNTSRHDELMTRSATLPFADIACCVPLVREPLTASAATDLARTLKAIADPARLRLLSMIAAHEGGEACVCDLIEPLGLTQPTVSHHLKVLVDAGLLTRDKRGVWAYFTLVPGALDSLAEVFSTQGVAVR